MSDTTITSTVITTSIVTTTVATATTTVTGVPGTVTTTATASPVTVTTTQAGPTLVQTVTQPASTVLQPTTVTQVVATTVTAPAATTVAPVGLTVDGTVQLSGPRTFELTGSVEPKSGVAQIEFYAQEKGRTRDLGAATLNKDGTFSFSDLVAGTQGFITAVATDAAGRSASATAPFSLSGNRQDNYDPTTGAYTGYTVFNSDGTPKTVTSVAADGTPLLTLHYRPNGEVVTDIQAPYQAVASQTPGHDVFNNGGAPETRFTFDPGHGHDVINGFRVDGPDHDTLDLPSSKFSSVADVLSHAEDKGGGVVIHDGKGDTIQITNISTADLAANKDDLKFHR